MLGQGRRRLASIEPTSGESPVFVLAYIVYMLHLKRFLCLTRSKSEDVFRLEIYGWGGAGAVFEREPGSS